MQQLQPLDVYTQVIEDQYGAMEDPSTGPWPVGTLKMIILMATLNISESARYSDLAANILASLPPEQRANFTETYAVPSTIILNLSSPPAWPEPRVPEMFRDFDESDLETYGQILEQRLNLYVDTQVRRVIRAGVFSSMSYMEQREEARAFLANPKMDLDDLPYLKAAGGDPKEVAEAINAKNMAWTEASAKINTVIQAFQVCARSPESDQAVKNEHYQQARTDVKAIVDEVVAA